MLGAHVPVVDPTLKQEELARDLARQCLSWVVNGCGVDCNSYRRYLTDPEALRIFNQLIEFPSQEF